MAWAFPMAPSPSVVVALIFTREIDILSIREIFLIILSLKGESFGLSATIIASILFMV